MGCHGGLTGGLAAAASPRVAYPSTPAASHLYTPPVPRSLPAGTSDRQVAETGREGAFQSYRGVRVTGSRWEDPEELK